jgi:hypothetical protein
MRAVSAEPRGLIESTKHKAPTIATPTFVWRERNTRLLLRACTVHVHTCLPALPYLYFASTVCLYAYTRVHMPHCLSCILPPFNTQGMLD